MRTEGARGGEGRCREAQRGSWRAACHRLARHRLPLLTAVGLLPAPTLPQSACYARSCSCCRSRAATWAK